MTVPDLSTYLRLELVDDNGDVIVLNENEEEETGFTFYFPGCSFEEDMSKDIRVISMSGQTRVLDFFRMDDAIKVWGIWTNDTAGDYDGRNSIDRVEELYDLCRQVECVGHFTIGGETFDVIAQELNCDQQPGEGDIISYNFSFAVIDQYLGVKL